MIRGYNSRLGIEIDKNICGIWTFGFNIVYEKYHHVPFELYLNIYLGRYKISIGRMYREI